MWGRLLYDPDASPDVWQRAMRHEFGDAGGDLGQALASASRILPTVTTAHLPSAANNSYWPEVYLNHSVIDGEHGPYPDTPTPRVFGAVSPLDPQLFSRVDDFADALLDGTRSGKYTPIEVACWIEDHASAASRALAAAGRRARDRGRPEYRRLAIDIAVAADLGRFFGAKLRAGVLYRIFDRTGDRGALEAALRAYRSARSAWADLVDRTTGVYAPDITVGEHRHLRGHWSGRLADIDADIAAVAARLETARPSADADRVTRAVAEAVGRPTRLGVEGHHAPAARFTPGEPLPLSFTAVKDYASVRLHYRHVNQAERWRSAPMTSAGRVWGAAVPDDYTAGDYPLQYYFEVTDTLGAIDLHPGLGEFRVRQPYYVVRRG